MSWNTLGLVVVGILAFLTLASAVISTRDDREQRDAEFLSQCHDAGYDAAKCRFFLTATGRMGGAAAVQMMIEAATPK